LEQAAQALEKARFKFKGQFEKRFFQRLKRVSLSFKDLVLVKNTRNE
jgi:hypothetical protein